MFGNNLLNPPQFLRREAPATLQADGIKPNLRLAVVTFHMNMRRFFAIASIEEKAVRTTPQDCGHCSIAKTRCSNGSNVQTKIPIGQRARDGVRRESSLGQNDQGNRAAAIDSDLKTRLVGRSGSRHGYLALRSIFNGVTILFGMRVASRNVRSRFVQNGDRDDDVADDQTNHATVRTSEIIQRAERAANTAEE